MSAPTPCGMTFRAEWDTCNHLARFETVAGLYYSRFGRLAPGKSEAMATYRSSSDPENRAQFDDWNKSGLAAHDAIMALAAALERIESLESQVEDLTP